MFRAILARFTNVAHYVSVVWRESFRRVDAVEAWVTRLLAAVAFLVVAFGLGHLTSERQHDIWLAAFVAILAFVFLFDTPAQIVHRLERQQDRRAIRERLAELGMKGQPLVDVAFVSANNDAARAQMDTWRDEVVAYLASALGMAYVFRFKNGMSGPTFVPPANMRFGTVELLKRAHGYLSAMDAFVREMKE